MIENTITVHEFTPEGFVREVLAASKGSGEAVAQAQYIARYAKRLGAKTLVRESHYVDRHYVDEFALYYSRMLMPPNNSVVRLHFFSDEFDSATLDRWLESGMRDDVATVPAEAVSAPVGYLGYCCVRPIPSTPIGRTVLAQWPDNGEKQRQIWATNQYGAHLANLALHVEGLPFQQQDVAVGACATAALWSALSQVARKDGMRAPTPAEIAELVGRPSRLPGRGPLPPSAGLTVNQLCEITKACGFAADVMQADVRPELFVASVHAYLLSGIPLVLALRGGGKGHAVTVAGFQLSQSAYPGLEMSLRSRSARMRKLYVHDDRVGPYARANVEPFLEQGYGEGVTFEIEMEGGEVDTWLVDAAVAPLYPKVRLTARGLILLAEQYAGVIEEMVGEAAAFDLSVDFRYVRAGEYLAGLRGKVDPVRGAKLARASALSRWCAVVRWYLLEKPILELVFDTTDVWRGDDGSLLRAVVGLDSQYSADVAALATDRAVPFA